MKRIIPILAALCLIVAMAVPVFAAVVSYNYVPKDDIDINLFVQKAGTYQVAWEKDTLSGNAIKLYRYTVNTQYSTYYQYFVEFLSDSSVLYYWLYESDGEPQSTYDSVVIYNPSDEIKAILDLVGDFLCDSSACSSIDADGDGYCDVCGGFFTPPPPGPLVEVVTALKEQNQLSQVLMQVVTMIPIGLACWVGYKGFRKVLGFLRRIIHQA